MSTSAVRPTRVPTASAVLAAEIRSRIMQARNNGAAVLLMRKIWTNFWRRPTAFW